MIFTPICKHKFLFVSNLTNEIKYECLKKIVICGKCPINKTYPICSCFKNYNEYIHVRR